MQQQYISLSIIWFIAKQYNSTYHPADLSSHKYHSSLQLVSAASVTNSLDIEYTEELSRLSAVVTAIISNNPQRGNFLPISNQIIRIQPPNSSSE